MEDYDGFCPLKSKDGMTEHKPSRGSWVLCNWKFAEILHQLQGRSFVMLAAILLFWNIEVSGRKQQ